MATRWTQGTWKPVSGVRTNPKVDACVTIHCVDRLGLLFLQEYSGTPQIHMNTIGFGESPPRLQSRQENNTTCPWTWQESWKRRLVRRGDESLGSWHVPGTAVSNATAIQ